MHTNTVEIAKPEVAKQTIIQPEEVKPQTTVKPIGLSKSFHTNEGFRLKQAQQITETVNVNSIQNVITSANEPFTIEQLKQSVADFAQKMQKQGKKQLALMLNAEFISLEKETEVILSIENRAQAEGFDLHKQTFLDFVRKNLNNQSISLRLQEKAADSTKRAYSPTEKFETMLQKNPALLTLKERLGMELDY